MEFNLPQWLFSWHQLLFMFYVFVAVVPTALFVAANNKETILRRPQLILHVIGKIGLDVALVMGISGTAIAMMANLLADVDRADSYIQSTYIVGPLLMGAYVTGMSYCLTFPQTSEQITYTLQRTQLHKLVVLMSFVIVLQAYVFDLQIDGLWSAGWIFFLQIAMTGLMGVVGSLSGKPTLRCFTEANVASTFVWMAMGVVFWFSEGGDYLSSRSNIFVIARTLFLGSILPVLLYYMSLLRSETPQGNYTVKTWHFAEAASFFVFLVLAPVGLTEFARESSDQKILQSKHELQQQEINELRVQIKLLMEQSGET